MKKKELVETLDKLGTSRITIGTASLLAGLIRVLVNKGIMTEVEEEILINQSIITSTKIEKDYKEGKNRT